MVLERYEYDAYGKPALWDAGFTSERSTSNYDNPYLFTGRRVDVLDDGDLKLQYSRNRYYDYHTGRWLTHDPWGITQNVLNPDGFSMLRQYRHGLSLYQYVGSRTVKYKDPYGCYDDEGEWRNGDEPGECEEKVCGPDITKVLLKHYNDFISQKRGNLSDIWWIGAWGLTDIARENARIIRDTASI
ncbi:MAG: hypothetical protein AMJ79_07935 [Phycisphaerae bacterium SM23_30]|nr:MAG: hypothetical protein AMJ79_07935 [Phycisphaerae bacterium SM23_30]